MPSAHMSSRLEDTSAILGEYMLKGWTLTDLHCEDCHTTPLMREPAGSASAAGRDRIQFCASCDGSPAGRQPAPSAATTSTPASFVHLQSQASTSAQVKPQADPSESISTLLLQGYSLLGDNCPNTSCRGIPLVGYPKKKDGSKDGRKMCVSCGGRWVDGKDLGGMTLMSGTGGEAGHGGAAAGSTAGSTGPILGGGESPKTKARREMYGLPGPSDMQKGKASATAQASTPVGIPDLNDDEDDFGLDRVEDDEPQELQRAAPFSAPQPTASTNPLLSSALSKTSSSLAKTLDRIATSLDRHTESNREEGRYFVDVKLHTEAIKDVMAVLETVQRFRP